MKLKEIRFHHSEFDSANFINKQILYDLTSKMCSIQSTIYYRNKADEALEAFQKQLTYSRTAMDCKNTMVMIESIKAARLVKERFGLIPGNLMNFGGPGLMGQPF